jgi:citrate lyase subunit beta/citryl-CoA lyase
MAGGEIRLFAAVESALGSFTWIEIAPASARLEAMIFGAEDFASSVRQARSREAGKFCMRSAVRLILRPITQAIDMVYVD